MKAKLTSHEKASATKRVRYEDELLGREAMAAAKARTLPKAWAAALEVSCSVCGVEAGVGCERGRRYSGQPHADRRLAAQGKGRPSRLEQGR